MVAIDLIQPRHNCAPSVEKSPIGHVYMPTSLLTVAARLLDHDIEVGFHDENLAPRTLNSRCVGIHLLGSPYIPVVRGLQQSIDQELENPQYVFGGQVVNGLSEKQLRKLFGSRSFNGNDDTVLMQVLGLNQELVAPENTSLAPAYELIADDHMHAYISRECSLYVSQGCKFACDFCAAVRTFKDPLTGTLRKVQEVYRDPQVIFQDLQYLVKRAERLGVYNLQLYMSNLDVFQTPAALEKFTAVVQDVKARNPTMNLRLRGLATVESFLQLRASSPKTIENLVDAGFHTVGFGVDGMTPQVWKAVNKGMNTADKCLDAIRSVREDFNMTPEILMVFGHAGIDTAETLQLAYEFTVDMVDRYGATPRPHIAKHFIPGNKGWLLPENQESIALLFNHPESFAALDFTALPSPLTHPDEELRRLASVYYRKICDIPGNTTLYLEPITPDMTSEELHAAQVFNQGRYDR